MNDWKRILEQLPEDENKQQNIENLEDTMRRSAVRKKSGGMKALIASLIILAALVLAVGGFWFYKAYDRYTTTTRSIPASPHWAFSWADDLEETTNAIEEYSDNYFSGKQINVICGSTAQSP